MKKLLAEIAGTATDVAKALRDWHRSKHRPSYPRVIRSLVFLPVIIVGVLIAAVGIGLGTSWRNAGAWFDEAFLRNL